MSLSLAGSGQNSSVAIVNSTLRASEEYGLWLHDKSGFTEFQGNTLTGNALGPAYVHLPSVDELTSGNDYSGNDTDEVVVEVGSGLQLTDPATWQDIGVPYYLMEKVGGAGIFAPLTIMPGVEILVEAGLGITVREAGTLTAVGTATDRITFRAKAGPWKGLLFLGTTGSFDFIDIKDGGSGNWGGSGAPANVTLLQGPVGARVTFSGSTSFSGAPYNIAFGSGNTIANGCQDPIWLPGADTRAEHCP